MLNGSSNQRRRRRVCEIKRRRVVTEKFASDAVRIGLLNFHAQAESLRPTVRWICWSGALFASCS